MHPPVQKKTTRKLIAMRKRNWKGSEGGDFQQAGNRAPEKREEKKALSKRYLAS